jgi:hypothetical protein
VVAHTSQVNKRHKKVYSVLPVPSIDAIEYGRGQLAALTYRSATSAREVHVLQLRNSFERVRIAHQFRYAFRVLDLMREVQQLGNGYWFPTPLRVVPIDEQVILVGPAPTRELQRHFPGITRAGYARILPQPGVHALPNQSLDDWLGLEVQDTVAWSDSQIAEAQAGMGPTISSSNVQFFSIEITSSPFGKTPHPVWTDNLRTSLIGQQNIVLCRERIATERYRYFLGRLKGGRLTAEAPAPSDLARFQFGFAALQGNPFMVTLISHNDGSILHLSANLPRPEQQLILALGFRDGSLSRKAYRVPSDTFVPPIITRLQHLGCEVRLTGV